MTQTPPPLPVAARPCSREAVVSFVFAVVSIGLGPLTGIPAIVLGHLALRSGRRSAMPLRGRGYAVAGLSIAYALLLVQTAVLLCVVCWNQITYRYNYTRNPPNYAFDLALESGESQEYLESVAVTIAERLEHLSVPHEVVVHRSSVVRVRLHVGEALPLDRARMLLTKSGLLEFRVVHADNDELVAELLKDGVAPGGFVPVRVDGGDYYARVPVQVAARVDSVPDMSGFRAPDPAYEYLLESVVKRDGRKLWQPFCVKRRSVLDGNCLKEACTDVSPIGQPIVSISFDRTGVARFAEITADYSPGGRENPDPTRYRRLAIVFDGTLYSAPVIREPILAGKAQICGTFSVAEAELFAAMLDAGCLPAKVMVVAEGELE